MIVFFDAGMLFLILAVFGLGLLLAGVQWIIKNAMIFAIIVLVVLLVKYIFLFIAGPSKRRAVIYIISDIIRMIPMALYIIFWFMEFRKHSSGIIWHNPLGMFSTLIFGGAASLMIIGVTLCANRFVLKSFLDDETGHFVLQSTASTIVVLAVGAAIIIPEFGKDILPWVQSQIDMVRNFIGL